MRVIFFKKYLIVCPFLYTRMKLAKLNLCDVIMQSLYSVMYMYYILKNRVYRYITWGL